jgi:hypothetical protein
MAVYTIPSTVRGNTLGRLAQVLTAIAAEQQGDKVLDGTVKITDITNGFRVEVTGRLPATGSFKNYDSARADGIPPNPIDIT